MTSPAASRSFARAILLPAARACALPAALALALAATAAAEEHAIAPTAFESFVADPNVIVEFEQWVGTIDSADAKVSVTALAAHDSAHPGRRMRGIRLTLLDNAGSDSVHLEPSQFTALARDLADVEQGKAVMRSQEPAAVWRVAGTASCWMPERPTRILCPSHRTGPDGSALLLGAYGGRSFTFPDRRPAELAALVNAAAGLLAGRRPAP